MKILFCTNVFETIENGPVKFANLLLGINRLYPEHELRILTEDTSAARPNVHKVPMKTSWRKSPLSQLIRIRVYHREAMRLRREFPFDVLVYNNALVGLLSAYRFPRTVGMINDYNNSSAKLTTFQPSKSWFKRFLFSQLERLTARYSDKIIVNSEYLRQDILKAYRLPEKKVLRLYKGIDINLTKKEKNAIDLSRPIQVLFIKTDFQLGGIPVLVRALGLLDYKFELTIVGPEESHGATMEKLTSDLKNVKIRLTGKQSQSEVFGHLRKADLFCVPSYREALGVANLEAMACGLPVISTRVGGIPEVLDHGRCGWLVPPDDPAALAEAIRECLTNPTVREQKLRAAAERVRLFSVETMYRNFLNILTE
jgi:colanic acid/amylovoran biosynthesis glycosyltransferase